MFQYVYQYYKLSIDASESQRIDQYNNDSNLLKMMRKSLMHHGNILVLYLRDYIIAFGH